MSGEECSSRRATLQQQVTITMSSLEVALLLCRGRHARLFLLFVPTQEDWTIEREIQATVVSLLRNGYKEDIEELRERARKLVRVWLEVIERNTRIKASYRCRLCLGRFPLG